MRTVTPWQAHIWVPERGDNAGDQRAEACRGSQLQVGVCEGHGLPRLPAAICKHSGSFCPAAGNTSGGRQRAAELLRRPPPCRRTRSAVLSGCPALPPGAYPSAVLVLAGLIKADQTGTPYYQLRSARRSPTSGLSNLCDRTSVGIPRPQKLPPCGSQAARLRRRGGEVIDRDCGQGMSGKGSVFFRRGGCSRCNSVAG